jgi:hypothetical protein
MMNVQSRCGHMMNPQKDLRIDDPSAASKLYVLARSGIEREIVWSLLRSRYGASGVPRHQPSVPVANGLKLGPLSIGVRALRIGVWLFVAGVWWV